MNSKLYSLNMNDALKGLITAALSGVVAVLYGVTSQAGFDLFSADWASILRDVINVVFASFVGYLGKNFLTTSTGEILGYEE